MELPAHVAQTVRRGDPDRYISVLYAPADRRDSLLALYAFAHEIASTRERVREPLAGEIRLQWWRDVISAGPGGGQGSPVAEALLETIRRHDLPTRPFLDLLDARVHDLYDDPIASRNDLDGYCGETSSAIIQLACLILDPKLSADVATIAGHAGCAQAIAGMGRTFPLQLARGQCPVPQELLASAGTSAETLVAGTDREASRRALMALVALGQEHAGAFVAGAGTMPSSLRPAFLPAALAPAYLARVEAMGGDALQRTADISPVRRHWILFRHAVFGWPAPG